MSSTFEKAFEELKARGIQLYQQGHYDEAFEKFSQALEERPSSYVVWTHRATAAHAMGMYDRALRDASEALRLKEGTYPKATALLARSLVALGMPNDAAKLAQELDPSVYAEVLEIVGLGQRQSQGEIDPVRLYADPTYMVTDYTGPVSMAAIQGKGRGLVTTSAVAAGTLLLCHRALLVGQDVGLLTTARSVASRLTHRATLDTVLRKNVEMLYKGPPGGSDSSPAFRAVEYNGFEVHYAKDGKLGQDDGAVKMLGLWGLPSLMNHSTRPSATHTFSFDCIAVRAIRDMERGEEVTTCYTGPCDPHSVRVSKLKKHLEEPVYSDDDEEEASDMDMATKRYIELCTKDQDYTAALAGMKSFMQSHAEATDPCMSHVHVAIATCLGRLGGSAQEEAAHWDKAAAFTKKRIAFSVDSCLHLTRALAALGRGGGLMDEEMRRSISQEACRHYTVVYGSDAVMSVLHQGISVKY